MSSRTSVASVLAAVAFAAGGLLAAVPSDAAVPELGGSYVVPVPVELADVASFPVDTVKWEVRRGEARLKYSLPADLVGTATNVDLRGRAAGAGVVTLRGAAGSATCVTLSGSLLCSEFLDGVAVDIEAVRARLAAQGLSAAEIERRIQVVSRFASEPIGFLHASR